MKTAYSRALVGAVIFFGLSLSISACSPKAKSTADNTQVANMLRPLTSSERTQDFDQLLSLFKSYYGPYEYKENLLSLNIEKLHAGLRAKAINAKTDEEFAGYVMQMGAALKDGHVQIVVSNTGSGVAAYTVPIVVSPIQGRAIVADVEKDLAKTFNIAVGDEVVSVDDKAVNEYLPTILKYRATARDESNLHSILFVLQRPSYMTDLVPTKNTVRISMKRKNGEINIVEVPWILKKYSAEADKVLPAGKLDLSVPFANDLNSVIAHRRQMGQVDPFFLTEQTQAKYGFVKVYPSDASRKKFGLADAEKPPIYAALYKHAGKTVLLVRIATYSPRDYKTKLYMKAYMALMSEFEPLADVLVLDQTHNPGGSYCADFYDLFAKSGDRQSAQYLRADRKWINDLLVGWIAEEPEMVGTWDATTVTAWSRTVEQAYDQGKFLSESIPLFSGSFYAQKRDFVWSKPMLVLVDELAGSCGDMFPMLVKANSRAKLFGMPTMGLGGNVEEVGQLPNSRIAIRMTRGLFFPYSPGRAPTPGEYIENNGVAPDISYQHTVDDFRAGFVEYVKAFSEEAVKQ